MFLKITILKSPIFMAFLLGITWLEFKYLPTPNFLVILCIAVLVDLLTGIAKSWVNGKATSSTGLRRTVSKIIQYGGFIIVGVLLLNISLGENSLIKYRIIIDGSFMFIILIEFISICENLIEISPNSKMVRYVINPFMRLIKGNLKDTGNDKEQTL